MIISFGKPIAKSPEFSRPIDQKEKV